MPQIGRICQQDYTPICFHYHCILPETTLYLINTHMLFMLAVNTIIQWYPYALTPTVHLKVVPLSSMKYMLIFSKNWCRNIYILGTDMIDWVFETTFLKFNYSFFSEMFCSYEWIWFCYDSFLTILEIVILALSDNFFSIFAKKKKNHIYGLYILDTRQAHVS